MVTYDDSVRGGNDFEKERGGGLELTPNKRQTQAVGRSGVEDIGGVMIAKIG